MDKKVVFTIVLVVIGLSSLAFGAISFGLIPLPQKLDSQTKKELQSKKEEEAKKKEETKKKEEETKKKEEVKKKEEAKKKELQTKENEKNVKEKPVIPRGPLASWLISDTEKEKGIQKTLSEKSKQIAGVWATLKVVNGVINVLQSVQIGGSVIVEASVNPMEFLSPIDNILDKISNLLLWAFGAVIFEKILLAISGYIVFLIVIPVCAIISIITIWTSKDKSKINRVVIVSVLVSLIVLFAIPVSFYLSSFIEKKVLTNNVNTVLESINAKGNTAAKMEKDLSGLKKIGSSITNYLTNAKNVGSAVIEDTINYFIIFIFTNVIIPILTILGLYFLAKYSVRMILKKQN
jgi:hypothetical protein